ncbi:hypothetical protein FHW23_001073 [Curtobacterium pusillum]|uniref:Uncharacterized protein n=1 Tax=Curtobacterium pusillum TaxID=69373 RepID=A0AAW3T3P7_9MICO|nr:hypothetical protein [Curtobacterium pusillum]MBA8989841.1 hypothetical protein [Curtobacterium pusillum]
MTDTSTRSARDTAAPWERHSSLQTFAELLLGLSFTAAVAFGGYAAVTGRMTVLSQGAGIVFLVTLTCVLVSWFRAVEHDEHPPATTTTTAAVDPIAAVDAEYRR